MYYVYVLQSNKDKSLYVGYTINLKSRLDRHNDREVLSTKHKSPWKVLFYEAFANKTDAKKREVYLKSGWGRKSLNKLLANTLL